MKYILVFLTFLATDCAGTDDIANQEVEKRAMDKLAIEIKSMAEASICSEEFICNYIGLGAKPCGGNWEYLVYSSAINVVEFETKIKAYNALEKKYNIKYGINSDCSLVMPPDGLICENGKCKAVYK